MPGWLPPGVERQVLFDVARLASRAKVAAAALAAHEIGHALGLDPTGAPGADLMAALPSVGGAAATP